MKKHKKAKAQAERPIELRWVTASGITRSYSSTDDAEITALCLALYLRYATGELRELHIVH